MPMETSQCPLQTFLTSPATTLQDGTGRAGAGSAGAPGDDDGIEGEVESTQHVMLSYEWGCQQSVMLIKTELQKAGYRWVMPPSFGPILAG